MIIIERKRRMNESLDAPCEGVFWFVNGDICAFSEQCDTSGRYSTNLEHKEIWEELKNMKKYMVDGTVVPYTYFPRGRVMVNPKYVDGVFNHYDVFIYVDDCCNNEECLSEIIYEFRLNKNCEIKYVGSDGGITSNHYTCRNCRGR